jgi:hypothetical protein
MKFFAMVSEVNRPRFYLKGSQFGQRTKVVNVEILRANLKR